MPLWNGYLSNQSLNTGTCITKQKQISRCTLHLVNIGIILCYSFLEIPNFVGLDDAYISLIEV